MDLQSFYSKEIKKQLISEFDYQNNFGVPKVEKIVVSTGLGEATGDSQIIDKMAEQLKLITGQKPAITKSKKAISSFKLRKDQPIGLKVTLHGRRMYDFLQKLVAIVLPRLRDFSGVSDYGFDKFGNYNLGFLELTVFPEADYTKLDKNRGLQVTIVTSAKTKDEAKRLLELFGMPFQKEAGRG